MGRPEGIIIGGGAAGLMAAITAAENGAGVTILEHMPRVGKKILSTGNGKCNLTNLDMRPDCYRCGTADFPHDGHRTVCCGRHGLLFPPSGRGGHRPEWVCLPGLRPGPDGAGRFEGKGREPGDPDRDGDADRKQWRGTGQASASGPPAVLSGEIS